MILHYLPRRARCIFNSREIRKIIEYCSKGERHHRYVINIINNEDITRNMLVRWYRNKISKKTLCLVSRTEKQMMIEDDHV